MTKPLHFKHRITQTAGTRTYRTTAAANFPTTRAESHQEPYRLLTKPLLITVRPDPVALFTGTQNPKPEVRETERERELTLLPRQTW